MGRSGPVIKSDAPAAEGFDSTIIEIVTHDGIAGYGEMAPLGSLYDPAFAEGARAMRELEPKPDRRTGSRHRSYQPAYGPAAEGPSLREVGDRHGAMGPRGQTKWSVACDNDGRG